MLAGSAVFSNRCASRLERAACRRAAEATRPTTECSRKLDLLSHTEAAYGGRTASLGASLGTRWARGVVATAWNLAAVDSRMVGTPGRQRLRRQAAPSQDSSEWSHPCSTHPAAVKLLAWCYEACVPVLSDLRHAYHTHGEASLPASSMNCGVKRRPMRVKPSDGLLSARRRHKRPEGLFGLLEAHTRASLARNCHIESLPLATFQLIPPWNCLISSGRKKCMQ